MNKPLEITFFFDNKEKARNLFELLTYEETININTHIITNVTGVYIRPYNNKVILELIPVPSKLRPHPFCLCHDAYRAPEKVSLRRTVLGLWAYPSKLCFSGRSPRWGYALMTLRFFGVYARCASPTHPIAYHIKSIKYRLSATLNIRLFLGVIISVNLNLTPN